MIPWNLLGFLIVWIIGFSLMIWVIIQNKKMKEQTQTQEAGK